MTCWIDHGNWAGSQGSVWESSFFVSERSHLLYSHPRSQMMRSYWSNSGLKSGSCD